MLKARSSLLIVGGSLVALLAMSAQTANAQISSCQYRDSYHQPCNPRESNDCRCVRPPRLITGGGGTPGTVEVRPLETGCRWVYPGDLYISCPRWSGRCVRVCGFH
jgi:hypothetical protein